MTINGHAMGYHTTRVKEWTERPQSKHIAGAGTAFAVDTAPASTFVTYELRRLTDTQKAQLETDLDDMARGTVSVVDDMGESFTGRPWMKKLTFTRRLGGLWSTSLTFRKES